MRALVTGASGFIGGNLIKRLIDRGDQVSCLVRPSSSLARLQMPGVRLVQGDLANPPTGELVRALAESEAVFHLAGVTRSLKAAGYHAGNVDTTANLLAALQAHAPPEARLLYLSSQAAAGPASQSPGITEDDPPQPVSAYGRAKLAAERLVLEAGTERWVCVIRPPAVYGPGDRDFLDLFRWIKRGIVALNGRRPLPMSLVHCHDLVEAMLLAVGNDAAQGRTYFVTDGQDHTFASIAQAAARALGRNPLIIKVPLALVWLLTRVNALVGRLRGSALYLNPDKWQEIKQAGWLCHGGRAHRELGFSPQWPLARGMAHTAQWYGQAGWL